jgi:hypothetical protein
MPQSPFYKGGIRKRNYTNSHVRHSKTVLDFCPLFLKEGQGEILDESELNHGFVPKNMSLADLAVSL